MLYHATHINNVESILRDGILTKYSTGARELVWLVDGSMVSYAVSHVAERHGWHPADVVLIEVKLQRQDLWGSAWPGIFRSPKDVPVTVLRRVRQYLMMTLSPPAPYRPGTSVHY